MPVAPEGVQWVMFIASVSVSGKAHQSDTGRLPVGYVYSRHRRLRQIWVVLEAPVGYAYYDRSLSLRQVIH